jgi:hypothetical protein
LTANAHRRRDGRGVECQTCKHGKVPKAALLRAQGWVGTSRRPRQTPAQKKAIAEREAAQKAHDKMIKEKLAAGWTRRGAFLSPPPTDPATPRPATHASKPERVKITETEEWQADWRARNAGRTNYAKRRAP